VVIIALVIVPLGIVAVVVAVVVAVTLPRKARSAIFEFLVVLAHIFHKILAELLGLVNHGRVGASVAR